MVNNVYNYLREQNIGIEASDELLERIDRNFEEIPSENLHSIGNVSVKEGEFVKFNRDRSKKYLTTRVNTSKNCEGIDFLRYGVLVRTVWKKDPLHYEIQNFLHLDESAVLNCFKKIYYATPSSKNKSLIHGSLIEVNERGILIVGGCWSGKTSLAIGLLEKMNGKLVSDGNVLISCINEGLVGYYLPRPIFVRFHSINFSENLSKILATPDKTESAQPFDREAIEEIISGRKYGLDAGLNFSRKKFAELMGIKTIPFHRVDKIIYTQFEDVSLPMISSITDSESYNLFLEREFPKEVTIGNIQHQREMRKPVCSVINSEWLKKIEKLKVSFDANKHLTRVFLEDLICSQ